MTMGEPHVTRRSLGGCAGSGVVAFEHSVIVLLPYRRYRRRAVPAASIGSPSVIEVGEQTRFGDELIVSRTTSQPALTDVELAEMTGELAEAWVAMTAWTLDERQRSQHSITLPSLRAMTQALPWAGLDDAVSTAAATQAQRQSSEPSHTSCTGNEAQPTNGGRQV